MKAEEKRRHPRIEKKIAVKISSAHGDILTQTQNLSCSGAYCCMSQRLEPMTKLRIHLLLPSGKERGGTKKITCEGVVVRVTAGDVPRHFNTAIFFNSIASKDVRALNEFIESSAGEKNDGPCH